VLQGLRYERRFGRLLRRVAPRALGFAEIRSGQWIEFEDENGTGNAQPDHILVGSDELWIFENKLTYRREGWYQLLDLYLPLCEYVWPGLRKRVVLVCKNLSEGDEMLAEVKLAGGFVYTLQQALSKRSNSKMFFHWPGVIHA